MCLCGQVQILFNNLLVPSFLHRGALALMIMSVLLGSFILLMLILERCKCTKVTNSEHCAISFLKEADCPTSYSDFGGDFT